MSLLITFAFAYVLGGFTALLILGLAVAARRGDRGSAPRVPEEESIAAWQHTA
jgi:hypothetical protein